MEPKIKLLLKGVGQEVRYIEFELDGVTHLHSKKRFIDMFGKEVLNDFIRKESTNKTR